MVHKNHRRLALKMNLYQWSVNMIGIRTRLKVERRNGKISETKFVVTFFNLTKKKAGRRPAFFNIL